MKRGLVTRSSLLWLALLVAAVAGIAWQMHHPTVRAVDEDDQLGAYLVSSPYAQWSAVEFMHRGERVRFERDAAGLWFRHEAVTGEVADHPHRVDAASAKRIGDVLATFSRTRLERNMPSEPARLPGYGLANPALIVLVHGPDGRVLQTVELGEVAPDRLSRYVHLPKTRAVHTIPDYQAAGLLSLLAAPAAPP